jgi:hypothetical protein
MPTLFLFFKFFSAAFLSALVKKLFPRCGLSTESGNLNATICKGVSPTISWSPTEALLCKRRCFH